MGFLGMFWVGVFAAGYPTGVNNVDSSIGGQLIGMATFLPLGFLTGYVASWIMKKLNILSVPPEVELMGLDVAEYEPEPVPAGGGRRRPSSSSSPTGRRWMPTLVLRTARDEVVI